MEKIYLDNNSTTALDPKILSAMMVDLAGPPANPSSVHAFGARAKKLLSEARHQVASFFGVRPEEVIFTSGGTESINLMLRGLPKGHIITTDIEHSAVHKTIQALEATHTITYIKPGLWGAPLPEQIEAAIRPDTKAIVLFAANNETGVKIDIDACAACAERNDVPLLLDGVSYIGKEPLETLPSGVSAFALSGHKFHAPKGVGALILRTACKLAPLQTGGNQEYLHRAGTENLSGILGLAAALGILRERQLEISQQLLDLRSHFECELFRALPDLAINGQGERISNTVNIAFGGCDGETLLMQLDMAGIATSLGSACSSGALEPSRVLTNMGLDRKTARSSIRFSFSRMNTKEETDRALERVVDFVKKMRGIAR